MISKKDNRGFEPVIAIPPGATIRENMGFLGMNQRELAVRLDNTEKHLSNILNDKLLLLMRWHLVRIIGLQSFG